MPTQAKQQANPTVSGFEPYVQAKDEEYMGAPMRAHFTKILNKWKQDLMQEVDRTVDHMK
ncbi:MAG: RNA polymerase-binding protein DksA, partial [Pseudomonas sp.]